MNNDNENAGQTGNPDWWRDLIFFAILALLAWGIVAFVHWTRTDHGSYGFDPWPVEG